MARIPSNGAPPNNSNGDEQGGQVEKAPKERSVLKRTWDGLGLNLGMLLLMAKGATPPVIAIAMYQATPVAQTYSTLGYLVSIMSILSFAIMPRAKFLQTMLLNIIGICIGSAVALLQIWCAVKARQHTTQTSQSSSGGPSPGAQVSGYNSSASAVSAIWLFFNIYISNTLRASLPQLQFPVIMYSIFANVASTYAPRFATMDQGISFAKRLLEAFLAGFAIAAGVSLLIFPSTSRKVVFKEMADYIGALRGCLKAQVGYMHSLEHTDMFSPPSGTGDNTEGDGKEDHRFHRHKAKKQGAEMSPEAKTLRDAIGGLGVLHGKLHGDLHFAKKEIACGKLKADDLSEVFRLFRNIMLPMVGMGTIVDIFERIAEMRGGKTGDAEQTVAGNEEDDLTENGEASKQQEKGQWNEIMKSLHGPFEAMTQAIDEGMEHVLYTLELAKAPEGAKRSNGSTDGTASPADEDVEAKGGAIKPGQTGFVTYLERKIDEFYKQREVTLQTWCKLKGINVPSNIDSGSLQPAPSINVKVEGLIQHRRNQQQLYLILYVEFLLWSIGRAVIDFARYADLRVEDGTMKKNRLIVPGLKRTRKWVRSTFKMEDTNTEQCPDYTESGAFQVYLGDSLRAKKDPEHLPVANAWERFGNGVRAISGFLGSPESAFGFRVACATMTIGIVAYLRDTQSFFVTQRLVWAMIMVAIGMTTTAGSGVFSFVGRIAGTTIAMCTSIVMWYIVDQKTGGIITMLWLFIFVEFYFLLRFPRFTVIALLSMVTQVLIVGYELEVRKIGLQVATSNGQPYYPIYELAPYRLACVAGGMAVAFIWTFFPYPITARSQLRKDLGASLYLLANFYSCVHTTVGLRLQGAEGDMDLKDSPGRKLEKARSKVFAKELMLLAGLREHSAFTAWEPTIGGKFPKQQYDTIIEEVQKIFNYLALISYSTQTFATNDQSPDGKLWVKNFSKLIGSLNVTSHEITSMLSLLSAAVTGGHPLPPYLKPPTPYKLSAKLEELDADILSINHIAEPGYSAFAVTQVAISMVSDELEKLITNVKALVGEMDFSFHVVSTSASSTLSDDTLWTVDRDKGKKD